MKSILVLGGIFNIGFAIFHILFWKIFHWNNDLKKLNFANKAIMQLLNVQIIYYFLFTACICFVCPSELLNSKLGSLFLGGTALFWFIRAIQQFIFLRAPDFKIHILTLLFLIGAILFALPLLRS